MANMFRQLSRVFWPEVAKPGIPLLDICKITERLYGEALHMVTACGAPWSNPQPLELSSVDCNCVLEPFGSQSMALNRCWALVF